MKYFIYAWNSLANCFFCHVRLTLKISLNQFTPMMFKTNMDPEHKKYAIQGVQHNINKMFQFVFCAMATLLISWKSIHPHFHNVAVRLDAAPSTPVCICLRYTWNLQHIFYRWWSADTVECNIAIYAYIYICMTQQRGGYVADWNMSSQNTKDLYLRIN